MTNTEEEAKAAAVEEEPKTEEEDAGDETPAKSTEEAAAEAAEDAADEDEDDAKDDENTNGKRKLDDDGEKDEDEGEEKKLKTEDDGDDSGPAPVLPSKEGTSFFNDADVLSGRGGGTNVHPGNRNFRDLINLHRRAYLKARKNDKPAISRAIVRSIRENNGRFLKKDEKSGLWFEIGDDAAREKTSQALRQRAPEMRKLLFDTEREEARAAAQEHLRQQRMLMGMPPDMQNASGQGNGQAMPMPPGGMFPNPAFLAMANQKGMPMPNMPPGADYSQMFGAFMGAGNMNPQFARSPPAPSNSSN